MYLQNELIHPNYALALYGHNLHQLYNIMCNGRISCLLNSMIGFLIAKKPTEQMTVYKIEIAIRLKNWEQLSSELHVMHSMSDSQLLHVIKLLETGSNVKKAWMKN